MKICNKSGPAIFCLDCMASVFGILTFVCFIQCVSGCTESIGWRDKKQDSCGVWSKIEYIFPAYQFGCWLGEKKLSSYKL